MPLYYVVSGAAGGGNGSFGSPWNALTSITGLVPGDDVHITGSFAGKWTMPATSGTATAPIRYIGNGGTVGDGGKFTISGGSQNLAYSAAYIQIHNAIFTGSTAGSVFDDAGECVFRRCSFLKGAGSATTVAGNLGTKRFSGCLLDGIGIGGRNLAVYGCVIKNVSGWGVSVESYRAAEVVIGCCISNCSSGGIQVNDSAMIPSILYNTICSNGGPGIAVGATPQMTIIGNLCASNTTKNISIPSSQPIFSDFNAIYGNASDLATNAVNDTRSTIILAGDPFLDYPTSYLLNNTAGAGALLRAALPDGRDIGGAQYVGGGGGGGGGYMGYRNLGGRI